MNLNDTAVSVAALVAVESAKMTRDFLPSLADVRGAGPGSDVAADLRVGEAAAAVTVVLVACSVAWATESGAPIVIGLALLLATVATYEYTLYRR